MNIKEDIVNITDARARFSELLTEVAEHRATKIIVVRGKPAVVIISVEEYQDLLENKKSGRTDSDVTGAEK